MRTLVKIGTRGSKLALWQANWVKDTLSKKEPNITFETHIIKTKGDKILDVPLSQVGGKGLFVKEIEEALLSHEVDIAVHSMKDMPSDIPEGLCIGAIPERECPYDVLISKTGKKLFDLPHSSRIGTSSIRREVQLKLIRNDFNILSLRGNLDTRIRKLETEDFDAIIVAAAGLKRLNLDDKITEYLSEDFMLPAVGQGALCIEIRKEDPEIEIMVKTINHEETYTIVSGERAFLKRLEGGCQFPIACYGKIEKEMLTLTGFISDITGYNIFKKAKSCEKKYAEKLGIDIAEDMLSLGAKELCITQKV
ncbi:MAG: hydroxymethylbilane synthase [Desulfobacterales bacterium]|nr:hydroxymethylbilane synthase [Desulfobacterales bacterium]MBF0397188.1 hydroxymethylbilane synthase [Desulfobacterales bacterium]